MRCFAAIVFLIGIQLGSPPERAAAQTRFEPEPEELVRLILQFAGATHDGAQEVVLEPADAMVPRAVAERAAARAGATVASFDEVCPPGPRRMGCPWRGGGLVEEGVVVRLWGLDLEGSEDPALAGATFRTIVIGRIPVQEHIDWTMSFRHIWGMWYVLNARARARS